jgi:hypothetical protein
LLSLVLNVCTTLTSARKGHNRGWSEIALIARLQQFPPKRFYTWQQPFSDELHESDADPYHDFLASHVAIFFVANTPQGPCSFA